MPLQYQLFFSFPVLFVIEGLPISIFIGSLVDTSPQDPLGCDLRLRCRSVHPALFATSLKSFYSSLPTVTQVKWCDVLGTATRATLCRGSSTFARLKSLPVLSTTSSPTRRSWPKISTATIASKSCWRKARRPAKRKYLRNCCRRFCRWRGIR